MRQAFFASGFVMNLSPGRNCWQTLSGYGPLRLTLFWSSEAILNPICWKRVGKVSTLLSVTTLHHLWKRTVEKAKVLMLLLTNLLFRRIHGEKHENRNSTPHQYSQWQFELQFLFSKRQRVSCWSRASHLTYEHRSPIFPTFSLFLLLLILKLFLYCL